MATVKRILQKAGCSKCSKEQLTLEVDKPIENTHLSFLQTPGSLNLNPIPSSGYYI
jgi:hypothetical protein